VPSEDCCASAIEGTVASMAPAKISFASFIEISRVFRSVCDKLGRAGLFLDVAPRRIRADSGRQL
jgi:hypothetical protein